MSEYKFLDFIGLMKLSNWNIKHIVFNNHLSNKFSQIKLGTLVTRDKTPVIVNDNDTYKRITIKTNGNGVVVRDIVSGKLIKTKKQFEIKEGQLVISKIDARNGAFGIVPMETDKAIITGNFWAYNVDKSKININYLLLILFSKYFVEKWYVCSNGSGNRLYLQEKLFLNTEIPVPTIEQQEAIIKKYEDKINRANKLNDKGEELNNSIDDVLFEELGIEKIDNEVKHKTMFLKTVCFENLLKWGVELNLGNLSPTTLLKSKKYENKPLGQVTKINPTTTFNKLDENEKITFLPMECISDVYGEIIEKRVTTVKGSKGYTKFIENDIIWAKITPCMQNGKCTVVNNLINNIGCGSTEYHVIRVNKNKINSQYIYHILRTKIVRNVAKSYFSGSAGQQRVSADYLENLNIPLPPLEIQNEVSNKISAIKAEIKRLNLEAAKLVESAKAEFEEEIFSE